MAKPSAPTGDWSEFNPEAYLLEYYADLGKENLALLKFLVKVFSEITNVNTMLDFGSGPTVYQLIVASNKVKDIHICDYLEANLETLQRWLNKQTSAFNWNNFTRTILKYENTKSYLPQHIIQREEEVRKLVSLVTRCDASLNCSFNNLQQRYDIVSSHFCAESITNDKSQWGEYFRNITSFLKPGGTLVMSALKGASSYSVGKATFPSVSISEYDIEEILLKTGFKKDTILIESVKADRSTRHYEGLMFTSGIKIS